MMTDAQDSNVDKLSDLAKEYRTFMSERQIRHVLYSTMHEFNYSWDYYKFSIETPKLQHEMSEHAVWSGTNPVFPFSYWTAEFKGRFPIDQAQKIDQAINISRTTGLAFYISHPCYHSFEGELKRDVEISEKFAYRILNWQSSNSCYILTQEDYPKYPSTENMFLKPGDFINIMGELKQVIYSQSKRLYTSKHLILVCFIPSIRITDPRILKFVYSPRSDLSPTSSTVQNFRMHEEELYSELQYKQYCIIESFKSTAVSDLFSRGTEDMQNFFQHDILPKNKIRHVFSVPFAMNFNKTNQVHYDNQACGYVHLNLQELI